MAYSLPPLPYATEALQPHFSQDAMAYHHGIHHREHVDLLNGLVEGSDFATVPLESLVLKSSGDIFNHAAEHWNHTFYWSSLAPDGGGEPEGALRDALEETFGSVDRFRTIFTDKAVRLFGAGWTWLVRNKDGSLSIENLSNAGTPITAGQTPLLACDMWEHAYYIDHRNRRRDYLAAFWACVNWAFAAQNLRGD